MAQGVEGFDGSDIVFQIRQLDAGDACPDVVLHTALLSNTPVVIHNIAQDWPILTEIAHRGDTSSPDGVHIQRLIDPDTPVPVSWTDSLSMTVTDDRDLPCEMSLTSFLDKLQALRSQNDRSSSKSSPLPYLKDWHFALCGLDWLYSVPPCFQDDWLNLYCRWRQQSETDDFRFIYLGPKGSCTPLHSDVMGSFSWSANIYGCKRWIFVHPSQAGLLEDSNGRLASSIAQAQSQPERYRHVLKLTPIVVEQRAGDVIFVPSGWLHEVVNMQETLSINHNWINGSNVLLFLDSLFEDFLRAREEIKDVEDLMSQDELFAQCNLLLKANCSFGLHDAAMLLSVKAEHICSTTALGDICAVKVVFDLWRTADGLCYLENFVEGGTKGACCLVEKPTNSQVIFQTLLGAAHCPACISAVKASTDMDAVSSDGGSSLLPSQGSGTSKAKGHIVCRSLASDASRKLEELRIRLMEMTRLSYSSTASVWNSRASFVATVEEFRHLVVLMVNIILPIISPHSRLYASNDSQGWLGLKSRT